MAGGGGARRGAARGGGGGRRWRGACGQGAAAAESGQRLFDGQQAAGLHQAHQADLQVEARLQRSLQIA